jgi:hypothetical protein
MYSTIDPNRIVETLDQLEARISQRFPGVGLAKVCAELGGVGRRSSETAAAIARPAILSRCLIAVVTTLGVAVLIYVTHALFQSKRISDDLFAMVQAIDAGVNLLVLTGATIYFLVSLEERGKRRRALTALNELRSFAHVIDMHQLTKDPMVLDGPKTAASPDRHMTPFELTRYLDYCSELLSLTAKIAALYAQSSADAVVIDAVSDLTTLTTNLSSKIWQKITLVQTSTPLHAASV